MSDDIHDVIARAEQSPGNAVSIDPPDDSSITALCGHDDCNDTWEDHISVRHADKVYRVCPDAFETFLDENSFIDVDDEPDPDRARDEAMDRDPPEPFD